MLKAKALRDLRDDPVDHILALDPGHRGIASFFQAGGARRAAEALRRARRVLITTGFVVEPGVSETDGPPGAAVLGRAQVVCSTLASLEGLDWVYLPFPVPPETLGDAVRGLHALGAVGANVTPGLSFVGPPLVTSRIQVPRKRSTADVPPYSRWSSAPSTPV